MKTIFKYLIFKVCLFLFCSIVNAGSNIVYENARSILKEINKDSKLKKIEFDKLLYFFKTCELNNDLNFFANESDNELFFKKIGILINASKENVEKIGDVHGILTYSDYTFIIHRRRGRS